MMSWLRVENYGKCKTGSIFRRLLLRLCNLSEVFRGSVLCLFLSSETCKKFDVNVFTRSINLNPIILPQLLPHVAKEMHDDPGDDPLAAAMGPTNHGQRRVRAVCTDISSRHRKCARFLTVSLLLAMELDDYAVLICFPDTVSVAAGKKWFHYRSVRVVSAFVGTIP